MYYIFISKEFYPEGGVADWVVAVPLALYSKQYVADQITQAVQEYAKGTFRLNRYDRQGYEKLHVTTLNADQFEDNRMGFSLKLYNVDSQFVEGYGYKQRVSIDPIDMIVGFRPHGYLAHAEMPMPPEIADIQWLTVLGYEENPEPQED